jgi:hypothetical protein
MLQRRPQPAFLVRAAATSAVRLGSTTPPASSEEKKKPAAAAAAKNRVLNMRRQHTSLYTKETHSNLVSEHPQTLRAKRHAMEDRQAVLLREATAARKEGNTVLQDKAEEEIASIDQKMADATRRTYEQYASFAAIVIGYAAGHIMAYVLFGDRAGDRLPYDPQEGFIEALKEQRERLDALEAACRASVRYDVEMGMVAASAGGGAGFWRSLFGAKSSTTTTTDTDRWDPGFDALKRGGTTAQEEPSREALMRRRGGLIASSAAASS